MSTKPNNVDQAKQANQAEKCRPGQSRRPDQPSRRDQPSRSIVAFKELKLSFKTKEEWRLMLKNQQKRARTEISGLRFILTSCSQSSRTDGCTGRARIYSFASSTRQICLRMQRIPAHYERASLSDCILAYHQQLTVVVVCIRRHGAFDGLQWQSTFSSIR